MQTPNAIVVDKASKKFCKDLKRSLFYGVQDIAKELFLQSKQNEALRPDEFWSLQDISFELKAGESLGLIGRNGSGKSTLLRLLSGLLKPDRGRICIFGTIGGLIELGAGFSPVLTGRENIYVSAAVMGLSKKETDSKFDDIVSFADIGRFIDAPLRSYSSGMKVRLGFAVAIHMRPDILLIDEVLAVGDMSFRKRCIDAINAVRKSGISILFVSHNLDQVAQICDKGLFLQNGRVKDFGPCDRCITSYVKSLSDLGQNAIVSIGTSHEYCEVQRVHFESDSDDLKFCVQSQAAAEIEIELLVKKTIKSPIFFLLIDPADRSSVALHITQAHTEKRDSLYPGRCTLRAHIDRMPLLPGRYGARLSMYADDKLSLLAKFENLFSFEVTPRPGQLVMTNDRGYGELEATWSVDLQEVPQEVSVG